MNKCVSLENLEMRFDMRSDGKTVRFMDYVAVAFYSWNSEAKRSQYGYHIYQPIETEAETGLSFCELRLECIDDMVAPADRDGFSSEGEALLAAFQVLQSK